MTRPYLARAGKWWITALVILLLVGLARAEATTTTTIIETGKKK